MPFLTVIVSEMRHCIPIWYRLAPKTGQGLFYVRHCFVNLRVAQPLCAYAPCAYPLCSCIPDERALELKFN